MSATCEEHVHHYRVGYGRDISTGCVFQLISRKFKTTSLVIGNRWAKPPQPLLDFPTAGFSASDIADGLDLIHVSLDCSWRNAEVLRNLLSRDSFVALYEFFELFFAERRMSAIECQLSAIIECQLSAIAFIECQTALNTAFDDLFVERNDDIDIVVVDVKGLFPAIE